MTIQAWILLGAFLAVLLALAWPLARWMTTVMQGRFSLGSRIEAPLYRAAGVKADAEMTGLQYALALLVFNLLGVFAVYALQRLQGILPFNPQGFGAVSPDSSFNTAISFVSNTNWQGYAGEATMSYLTQMLALTVQNFLSAENLGRENTKVIVNPRGTIKVNDYCETDESDVYAIGDVIDIACLAHVASTEGFMVVEKIVGKKKGRADKSSSRPKLNLLRPRSRQPRPDRSESGSGSACNWVPRLPPASRRTNKCGQTRFIIFMPCFSSVVPCVKAQHGARSGARSPRDISRRPAPSPGAGDLGSP